MSGAVLVIAVAVLIVSVVVQVRMLLVLDRIERAADVVATNLADVQQHARRIESADESVVGEAADFAAGGNDRALPPAAVERGDETKRKPPEH